MGKGIRPLSPSPPLPGGEFAGKVERMGVTAYLFQSQKKAEAAEQVLLDSTGR
jgi:hypothetical protein